MIGTSAKEIIRNRQLESNSCLLEACCLGIRIPVGDSMDVLVGLSPVVNPFFVVGFPTKKTKPKKVNLFFGKETEGQSGGLNYFLKEKKKHIQTPFASSSSPHFKTNNSSFFLFFSCQSLLTWYHLLENIFIFVVNASVIPLTNRYPKAKDIPRDS